MRYVTAAILALALSVGAAAQHRGGSGGAASTRTNGYSSGYGNVVFPGTGGPPPMIDPFAASFASRLGATISGYPPYRGFPSRGRRGGAVVPYMFPVYIGGLDNPYPYQQTPDVTVIAPPQYPTQPVAPIVINQYFGSETARPVVTEYGPDGREIPPSVSSGIRTYQAPSNAPAEPSQSDSVVFFVALKDSSVYTAVAYWVEGETLHYVTPHGKHNQVSLALVDRNLSARLNEGQKVDFHLPPNKQ
ncbi:MAG: hypothetical protein ABSH05_21185 [Bryobacteraceae bacterium]|jgi:hypothetical protein